MRRGQFLKFARDCRLMNETTDLTELNLIFQKIKVPTADKRKYVYVVTSESDGMNRNLIFILKHGTAIEIHSRRPQFTTASVTTTTTSAIIGAALA